MFILLRLSMKLINNFFGYDNLIKISISHEKDTY